MSNFEFLKSEWFDIYELVKEAEECVRLKPIYACLNNRKALEKAVVWMYKNDSDLVLPYDTSLNSLLHEKSFINNIPQPLVAKVNLIRKLGNIAAHESKKLSENDALHSTFELFHFLYWLYRVYSKAEPVTNLTFDINLIPKQTKEQEELEKLKQEIAKREAETIEKEDLIKENQALLAEIQRIKEQNRPKQPKDYNYNEADTRKYFIDVLLKEVGWDITKPDAIEYEVSGMPKTYDNLFIISEKIKKNTKAYSYLPNITENDTMVKILNKYGISEVKEYNSIKSIEIFEMFKYLYQKDLIPPETITMTHREALEQYMAGKIVFYQGGANFLNMIKENSPKIYAKTDVTEQIKGSIGQNDFSVMNFVIPTRAKYKNEALDFCLYLTNKENQLKLAKLTNVIATNSKALDNEFYRDYSNLESKARSLSAKQIKNIKPAFKQKEGQKDINLKINTAVQAILLDKDTVENVLNELTNIDNLFD